MKNEHLNLNGSPSVQDLMRVFGILLKRHNFVEQNIEEILDIIRPILIWQEQQRENKKSIDDVFLNDTSVENHDPFTFFSKCIYGNDSCKICHRKINE